MGLESAGHPLEGFEVTSGDAGAPGVEGTFRPKCSKLTKRKARRVRSPLPFKSRMRRRSLVFVSRLWPVRSLPIQSRRRAP